MKQLITKSILIKVNLGVCFLDPVMNNEHEIFEIISDLESSKSSDLPSRVIKQSSIHFVPKLTKYFNEFIEKGVFPKILKTGRITPTFKKGDAQMFGNYRPVCTLPIFGKIFEKIIFNRLQNFFSSKGINHYL